MIAIENLQVRYNLQTALSFPDWALPQGEKCLLLGNSGSGKTTLLHVLAGLLTPYGGKVHIAGQELFALSKVKRDRFRGQNIGLVFQRPHLVAALSVADNLRMAQYFANLPQSGSRVNEVLNDLGIAEKQNSGIHELSQGQQQRASIARALLNKPKLILADEPTSSLDDRNCEAVAKLLLEQSAKYRATLVISTHDQRLKSIIPNQFNLEKVLDT